jgi:diaminopimelate decarboxylase
VETPGGTPARDEIWRAGLLAGLDPRDLARTFGTPLHVYDLETLAGRAARLRAALPDRVDVAYAIKANPSLAVIATLASAGPGADVSSEGELDAALRAGMAPRAIVVTGPGKSDRLLRRAVESGVRAIAVDSPGEVPRVEVAARAAGTRAAVLVRLAQPGQTFGMSWKDALAAARLAVASDHLEPVGVHAFAVSSVLDAGALVRHVQRTVDAAVRLAGAAGFPLALVDVGGGLGIPYRDGEEPLDLATLAAGMGDVLAGLATRTDVRETRILIEPGRYLSGPSGAYLARVVDVKRLDGRHVAVLDGGINHLLAPALVGRRHRLRLVGSTPLDGRPLVPVTITGPLCTSLDVVGRLAEFPEPRPGDLVAVLDTGAYGFTQSMPWFLSHVGPAEVAIAGGRAELVRDRLDPAAVVAAQGIPRFDV